MRQPDFLSAIEELLAPGGTGQQAVMCSESLWWRRHRRLIADFVEIARGIPVGHLMHDGTLAPHRRSPGARLRGDGLLVYDGGQEPLDAGSTLSRGCWRICSISCDVDLPEPGDAHLVATGGR